MTLSQSELPLSSTDSSALSALPARFSDALERLDHDVELLREMAELTAPDFRPLMKDAEESIQDGACNPAITHLHKLKGMLATFESDGVVLKIQEMLNAARRSRHDELKQLFAANKSEIGELIKAVESLGR